MLRRSVRMAGLGVALVTGVATTAAHAGGGPPSCILDPCDPANTPEGEPCTEGLDDCFNGGCNCTSGDPLLAFSPIACRETVCGTSYFNGTLRDTDWYRHDLTFTTSYTFVAVAEFGAVIGRVENEGVHDCTDVVAFAEVNVESEGCQELQVTSPHLNCGTYWFFVAPDFTSIIFCGDEEPGNDYIATLSCDLGSSPGVCACPWDLNQNGQVDFADLLKLLASWGPCPMP